MSAVCTPLPYGAASRYSPLNGGYCGALRLWSVARTEAGHGDAVSSDGDETALIAEAGRGDAQAYRALSDRHLGKIVGYANRLLADSAEAEDVAQETFLRLWKQAAKWQPKAKLHTWLFRVAHNLCIDRLRARRPAEPDALERQSSGDRPSGLLARKQLASEVEQALAELPERQRAAIALTHYQGLSQADAADVLQCGVEAVESLLSRGRRTLRQRLSHLRDDDDEERT